MGDGEPSAKEVADGVGNSARLAYLPRLGPSQGRNSCPRQSRSNQRTEGHTGHPPASRASPDETTIRPDVEDNREEHSVSVSSSHRTAAAGGSTHASLNPQ